MVSRKDGDVWQGYPNYAGQALQEAIANGTTAGSKGIGLGSRPSDMLTAKSPYFSDPAIRRPKLLTDLVPFYEYCPAAG